MYSSVISLEWNNRYSNNNQRGRWVKNDLDQNLHPLLTWDWLTAFDSSTEFVIAHMKILVLLCLYVVYIVRCKIIALITIEVITLTLYMCFSKVVHEIPFYFVYITHFFVHSKSRMKWLPFKVNHPSAKMVL